MDKDVFHNCLVRYGFCRDKHFADNEDNVKADRKILLNLYKDFHDDNFLVIVLGLFFKVIQGNI